MKKLIIIVAILSVLPSTKAQIGQGGLPYSFQKSTLLMSEISTELLPKQNNQLLLQNEMEESNKEDGFIFGKEIAVCFNLSNSGTWEVLENGDKLWRLAIKSTDAYSLNLIFDKFYLPKHSRLFIYTADRSYVTGSFNYLNNNADSCFATSFYPNDEIVLEYYQAKQDEGLSVIELTTVVHAYKPIISKYGTYGSSGSCNININCPLGDEFQVQKRSVALILRGGSAHCTGSLINNTNQDSTPYFLTANHCVANYLNSIKNFVFIFGYESSNCANDNELTSYSVNGATLIARHEHSDFCLLLLNSRPPAAAHPYYAGWNRTSNIPDTVTGIHHPSGDLKKISQSTQTISLSQYESDFPKNTHFEFAWSQGVTEGGSSGSPLFDQNKLIVGQLEGGGASCSYPSEPDLYGRFFYSWTNNNNSDSSARLDKWLDPNNTGITMLPGYDPESSSSVLDGEPTTFNVVLFPNPVVNNQLNIKAENEELFQVDIVNPCGQFIYSDKTYRNNRQINVSGLQDGLYLLIIHAQDQRTIRKRFVIQR